MDDALSVFISVLFIALVAFFSGAISYSAGTSGVREQAVAAGVACYVSTPSGKAEFKWNCKQQ